jgi:glycosyltransferase involved in cell wall biosynthesis
MTREVALKIAMDVTPLLGNRTGIGRYVGSLLGALADRHGRVRAGVSPDGDVLDADLRGVAFTARRRTGLSSRLPPGVRTVGPPVPARALQWSWARTELPSITAITGRVELFHGTNFVLPPTGRAAGVVTVHDLSFLRTPQTVSRASLAYRALVPRSIGRAGVVCVPSQAVATEVAAEYRLAPERIAVTPLGVDPAWASATGPDPERRRRLGLPPDYLVFSGSLEPRKNLPLLLEAQRRLRAEDPEWPTLVLLGPPGWGPQLDLGALPSGAVHLTGYLDDEDLRSVVAGARALVYPSLYEGFGLPPLEAFACGVPVIASDLPVIREVVGDDPALARLVPSGDLDALTAALHAQVFADEDPEVADRRRRRAEHFTWEVTAQRTWDAYRRALTAG